MYEYMYFVFIYTFYMTIGKLIERMRLFFITKRFYHNVPEDNCTLLFDTFIFYFLLPLSVVYTYNIVQ